MTTLRYEYFVAPSGLFYRRTVENDTWEYLSADKNLAAEHGLLALRI